MNNSLVIIPTYNEIENIESIVHSVMAVNADLHLLIVDDNSPDGTAQAVKKLQSAYQNRLFLEVRDKKSGLGTAYIHGFKWAIERSYTYVFEMDGDFSHNPKDLPKLYHECHENKMDLCIGSRYVRGVNVVNWPMSRVLLSYGASKYVRLITGMPIHDTTAGFICYKVSLLRKINLDRIKFIGYAFQIELKYKAYLLKANIKEIPIIFTDRTKGTSKMSSGIIKEAIWGVVVMRIKSFFGKLEL